MKRGVLSSYTSNSAAFAMWTSGSTPSLNVRDNVAYGLMVKGVGRAARYSQADEMLAHDLDWSAVFTVTRAWIPGEAPGEAQAVVGVGQGAGDGGVELVDVGLVVLRVVNLHRPGVDVRLERSGGIRQFRKFEGHGRVLFSS